MHLPANTARLVLSGKYSEAKDPLVQLAKMASNLELRSTMGVRNDMRQRMVDAQRRGDRDGARLLAQLAEAERKGDRELAQRLTEEMSNRKQAD